MRPLRKILDDYEWIHTWIGVAGNVLFFAGSILFLWESTKLVGTWMFIVGSAFMLVGSVGSALVRLHRGSDDVGERARQTSHPAQRSFDFADA